VYVYIYIYIHTHTVGRREREYGGREEGRGKSGKEKGIEMRKSGSSNEV